jgi:hypothetical protein
MKNRRLKRWVTYLLVVIAICSILVAISDFRRLSDQLVYSTVGMVIFAVNAKIIAKYGTLE